MRTKRQYLDAMGIDIWTLRCHASSEQQTDVLLEAATPNSKVPEASEVEAAPQVTATKKSAATTETGAKKNSPEQEEPRFTLAFLQYDQLGLCLSLPSDQTKIPKHFCDDLARSLGKNPDTGSSQLLEWPLLNSSSIDQSLAAAKEVVMHKFNLLPATVLVFGEAVKQYHPDLEALVSASPTQETGRQTVYLFDEVTSVMQSADAKRALWQTLQQTLIHSKAE